MPISIDISGIKGVMAEVNKTILQANVGTHKALVTFAENVEKTSKDNLRHSNGPYGPTSDTGHLMGSITGSVTGLTASVVVRANYAAYIEFGTRKFAAAYVATLPPDWATYAGTFRGKTGGSFEQFVQDIMQWVKSKGIGAHTTKGGNVSKSASSQAAQKQAAYAIALSILRNGIRAQPFLYPAVVLHTKQLLTDIKEVFEG